MRETEDGFRIAEEDLRLRGEGDLLGTRQSGMPGFRIALPEVHGELLALARDEAKLALARDPDFASERAEALRLLLYLFGRDDAVRLMRAGGDRSLISAAASGRDRSLLRGSAGLAALEWPVIAAWDSSRRRDRVPARDDHLRRFLDAHVEDDRFARAARRRGSRR